MAIAAKQILGLLEPGRPAELRRAAAMVLGEVGGREGEIARELCERLNDADAGLRLEVVKAVGKLKIDAAMPTLLERIKHGGEEAEQAALAVAHLGARGTRALTALMPKVAPGLRRYIASALAAGGTTSAETAAVEMLLDTDPGVVEATTRSFLAQVPTLTSAQKKTLGGQVLELLDAREPPTPIQETAMVRILVALDDPRVADVLWDRIVPPHPPEVRAAALQSLGKWVKAPGKEQMKRLFTCAAEADFRLAAPALMILKELPESAKAADGWLSLLSAPDVMVRRVAIEKVGDRDKADVAEALLQQLQHPERSLRDMALARLTRLEAGRKALAKELLATDSADRAWSLARAQAPFVKDYPPSWRDPVFARACEYQEEKDRRADPLLFLLREADPAALRDRLEEKALNYRKKKAYDKALTYLKLLARDPACAFPIRLELAACGLKLSAKELGHQDRADDPSLEQFAGLVQHHGDELMPALEKVKWLDAEDLYYLGFDLVERGGPYRKFGAEVLHLLIKRSGRTKIAQQAKSKLKSVGLD